MLEVNLDWYYILVPFIWIYLSVMWHIRDQEINGMYHCVPPFILFLFLPIFLLASIFSRECKENLWNNPYIKKHITHLAVVGPILSLGLLWFL